MLTKGLARNPKDWPESLVRKSIKLICTEIGERKLNCSVIPSWTQVAKLPADKIAILTPKELHYDEYMLRFGMTLTDGTKTIGGKENLADKTADMPENLTKIEVCFRKDEEWMHHMIFYGSTRVYMGLTKEEDEKEWNKNYPKRHAGRVETVVLAPGEQLLGCEMYHDDY